jgi:sugar lactone lactonase YvrE
MSPTTAAERPDSLRGSELRDSGARTTESAARTSVDRDGRGRVDHGRRGLLKALPLAGLALVGSGTAAARAHEDAIGAATPGNGSRKAFPDLIPLPNGFRPEGIVAGRGTEFFVGSLADGSVYRGDLRTGEGAVLVEGTEGRVAVGLSYDRRSDLLFVAGNGTGQAFVYDAENGEDAAVYDLTAPGSFVNDVVVTRSAAYFTDSFRSFLYRVPLGPGGRLPDQSAVEEIELGGDFTPVSGFNTNGIDAPPDGDYLIIVNSSTGLLYRVDPETGVATEIGLGGDTVTSGDGILLDGRTLYVVQNQLNQIAVVELVPGATAGEVVDVITDDDFDVPTTVAEFGNALYAVNARFGTPPTPDTEYDVVRVSK